MGDWGAAVGALTGILALIVSIISYRYAKKIDDRAIVLKRDELVNDISIHLEKLPIHIREADRSKMYNLAAKGQFHSGVTVAWTQSITELNNRLDAHKEEFEEILKLDKNKVLQLRKLDRLKKVLQEHVNWLNGCLKEDREEVLSRLSKV